jgi:hypothetical protein
VERSDSYLLLSLSGNFLNLTHTARGAKKKPQQHVKKFSFSLFFHYFNFFIFTDIIFLSYYSVDRIASLL